MTLVERLKAAKENAANKCFSLSDRLAWSMEAGRLQDEIDKENQAARITALEAREAEWRKAAERCALIVERNLYRQSEKVEDVPRILRTLLETPEGASS